MSTVAQDGFEDSGGVRLSPFNSPRGMILTDGHDVMHDVDDDASENEYVDNADNPTSWDNDMRSQQALSSNGALNHGRGAIQSLTAENVSGLGGAGSSSRLTASNAANDGDRAASEGDYAATEQDNASSDLVVAREQPPRWEERLSKHAFRSQRINKDVFEEVFEGSFDVLAGLNPDHYSMPFGSIVVCVKTPLITSLLLSLEHGIWSFPTNVAERIHDLWTKRGSGDERVLLLFSIPGSKQFCGVAEVKKFRPDQNSDIWEDSENLKGTLYVNWLFCKMVPYEDVRRVVSKNHEKESATQMWNGMHYSEEVGREVIRAYVEYPHSENLLARLKGAPPTPPIRGRHNHGGSWRGGINAARGGLNAARGGLNATRGGRVRERLNLRTPKANPATGSIVNNLPQADLAMPRESENLPSVSDVLPSASDNLPNGNDNLSSANDTLLSPYDNVTRSLRTPRPWHYTASGTPRARHLQQQGATPRSIPQPPAHFPLFNASRSDHENAMPPSTGFRSGMPPPELKLLPVYVYADGSMERANVLPPTSPNHRHPESFFNQGRSPTVPPGFEPRIMGPATPTAMPPPDGSSWSTMANPGTTVPPSFEPRIGILPSAQDWRVVGGPVTPTGMAPSDWPTMGNSGRQEQLRSTQSYSNIPNDDAQSRVDRIINQRETATPVPWGRHLRHVSRSSVDLRMGNMVDHLVDSPSRRNEGARQYPSFDDWAGM